MSVSTHTISSLNGSTSRSSNTAGAPLPSIPRRGSSTSRIYIPTPDQPTPAANPAINVQRATPPAARSVSKPSFPSPFDSDTSSSSSESSSSSKPRSLRIMRKKGVRNHSPSHSPSRSLILPPPVKPQPPLSIARSVSASSSTPLMYVPGTPLRATLEALKPPLKKSESAVAVETRPTAVRKKSGQLVRSSLKVTKPHIRGSLTVVTNQWASKSEPNTPSKAVHFDSQLEHVKLFLAEQKPMAVSRDGSPTDTDGDSDFPSFIYGEGEGKTKRRLVMQVANMPSIVNMAADVALTELKLSPDGTNIIGRVRLRNLAYHKWLSIRFTFDAWQTVSEVAGKYAETIDEVFDSFTFSIRLHDMLSRIEGKTMIMALKFCIGGKEMWDNNGGQNYLATFSTVAVRAKIFSGNSSGEDNAADVNDLQNRLEKIMNGREQDKESYKATPPPALNSSASFSSRYDFKRSLDDLAINSRPPRTPSQTTTVPSTIPWPEKAAEPKVASAKPEPSAKLGSPRDSEDFRPAVYVNSSEDDNIISFASGPHISRKHHRGYFDIPLQATGSHVKKTQPGTPRLDGADDFAPPLILSPRFHSFPPLMNDLLSYTPPTELGTTLGLGLDAAGDGGSDLSTPSMLSSASSTAASSPLAEQRNLPAGTNSYSQFIDRFCFYTGPESASPISSDPPSRCSSASSFSDVFDVDTIPSAGLTETRDDSTISSGSATPTEQHSTDLSDTLSTPTKPSRDASPPLLAPLLSAL